jgi:Skp family chaperone for outer membrane proteins
MKRRVLIVLAMLAILGGYFSGSFDHALVNVGLNFKECARNGFGATFCGKELDEYRERIGRVKQENEATQQKIKESSEKAQHESEALQQRASEQQHAAEEQLRRSTEGAP